MGKEVTHAHIEHLDGSETANSVHELSWNLGEHDVQSITDQLLSNVSTEKILTAVTHRHVNVSYVIITSRDLWESFCTLSNAYPMYVFDVSEAGCLHF